MSKRSLVALAVTFVAVFASFPATSWGAPPSNDEAGGAIGIDGLPFGTQIAFQEATHGSDDPTACIDPDSHAGYATVWYSFTPASDLRVSVTPSQAGVGVDAFTGTPGSLGKIACLSSYQNPEFRFDAAQGVDHLLMISVPSQWAVDVSIVIDVAPAGPPNDDFDDATEIDGYDLEDSVAAVDAIDAIDDPLCSFWKARHTVWYRYTPATDATLRIHTRGSTIEGAIAVYRGERGSLTQVSDCDYYIYGEQPLLTVPVEGGVTYSIMAGTLAGEGGELSITFRSRIASSLSLTSSHRLVRFGGSVTLSGELRGFQQGTHPLISLYRWGEPAPVATAPVDDDGAFAVPITPTEHTTYLARWPGGTPYAAARSARVTVKVQVAIRGAMVDFHDVQGRYHLYRRTTDPSFVVRVRPEHRDRNVTFILDRFRSGAWHTIARAAFALDRRSRVQVWIDHETLTVDAAYRIRGKFPSDDDHRGGTTSWNYFRRT